MRIQEIVPGQRHPSWPWWLRSGMFVHFNYPDGDGKPSGRVVGAVGGDSVRAGQPVHLAVEDFPPRHGESYDFKVNHPMFLAPVPPERLDEYVACAGALFPASSSEASSQPTHPQKRHSA